MFLFLYNSLVESTRKVVIKGRIPSIKKTKFISQFDLQKLINNLNLTEEINFDWFILLIAKTGLRFSEASALTKKDFNFAYQTITVSKTWNYKSKEDGFVETKNTSSKRVIQLDWKTNMQFAQMLEAYDENKLIFINGRVFNSTVNNRLKRYCEKWLFVKSC